MLSISILANSSFRYDQLFYVKGDSMVQVDVFWSFAVGAGFAARSAGLLEKEEKPLESKPFIKNVLWLSIFFVPSGTALLWMFPDWETMQVGTWATIPGWLVALFSMTNVLLGVLGFWLATLLIKKRRLFEAHLLWVLGYFGMFFILFHGWDGSGYDRFYYSPMAWDGSVTPWVAGQFTMGRVIQFFVSPVGATLGVMGIIMFPPFFRWMKALEKEAFSVAAANGSDLYHLAKTKRSWPRIIGIYSLGGAVVASFAIRYFGAIAGTLVFGFIFYLVALRKGSFCYREFFQKESDSRSTAGFAATSASS